jgi:hypothetical protein
MADRSRRVGRSQSASPPVRIRSDANRFGAHCRERFRIRSSCLSRSDSATMERAPPAQSKRARMAMKWMKKTTRSRITESQQDGKFQRIMGDITIRQPHILGPVVRIQRLKSEDTSRFRAEKAMFGHNCAASVHQRDLSDTGPCES